MSSAKNLLEEAVARDPNFAQVRGMLADLWEFGGYFGWEHDIDAARERALGHARGALASDSSDPQVLARRGFVLATLGGAHAEGSALLDRAIAANPNCAEAYFRGAWVSIWNGDFATAVSRVDTNERLDPLSAEANGRMGIRATARFFLREFDAAIEAADQAVGDGPNFHAARCILISSLAHVGRDEEARAHAAEFTRRNPEYTRFLSLAKNPFRHRWMAEPFLTACGGPESQPADIGPFKSLWVSLADGCCALKTSAHEGWIVLDFLGFSRPESRVFNGLRGLSRRSDFSPA